MQPYDEQTKIQQDIEKAVTNGIGFYSRLRSGYKKDKKEISWMEILGYYWKTAEYLITHEKDRGTSHYQDMEGFHGDLRGIVMNPRTQPMNTK